MFSKMLRQHLLVEHMYRSLVFGCSPPLQVLALCLSSRRNLCIHERVIEESDREAVDGACRDMTASWVRKKAEAG